LIATLPWRLAVQWVWGFAMVGTRRSRRTVELLFSTEGSNRGVDARDAHSVRDHAPRRRGIRSLLALAVLLVSSVFVAAGEAATAGPAAAAAPACSFSGTGGVGAIGPLVFNVTPGAVINIKCTGFLTSHSYLLVETSLLVAIDPAAKPLLTGQAVSLLGLLAIIAALPEMNAQSVAFPNSDATGHLNYAYTIPSSQPLDPNATCPPSTEQLNSGLIGCAVAMIDLSTFKPVTIGTFVISYKGQPVFPPKPTVAVSPSVAHVGQSVSIGDAPGAKTYWWLATLVSLYANLGGGSAGGGPVPVVVRVGGRKVHLTNGGVTPASYNGVIFTPPVLSGTFPAKRPGHPNVSVTLAATLLGIGISNDATTKLRVLR
jgi:hypothetical protein